MWCGHENSTDEFPSISVGIAVRSATRPSRHPAAQPPRHLATSPPRRPPTHHQPTFAHSHHARVRLGLQPPNESAATRLVGPKALAVCTGGTRTTTPACLLWRVHTYVFTVQPGRGYRRVAARLGLVGCAPHTSPQVHEREVTSTGYAARA